MADNNKVTIDADYFAKLYDKAKSSERYVEAINSIAMKRDELLARLAKCEHRHSDDEFCELQDRLAAAERCIEDIAKAMSRTHTEMRVDYAKIEDIIRAYREAKEAK